MKTILDNNSRVFLIQRDGFFPRDYFCNLETIPEILKTELEKNDSFKIFEYWNRKFKTISKSRINEMFKSHKIDFKIS